MGQGPAGGSSGRASSELGAVTRRMRRHTGTKAAGVVVALLVTYLVQQLARKSALQWGVVGTYLFSGPVMAGVLRTLLITAASILIAIVLGMILANMRLSNNRVMRTVAVIYVWFFRSVPLLVLLILAYNFSLLYSSLSIGVPLGPTFVRFETQHLITGMVASILTFGFQQGAYTSEVLRAAIMSVPRGQVEAAESLGMTSAGAMWRVVLPQAARIAIPPVANETINLCKSTALVAFISVPDLLYSVQEIYARTFQVVPLLVVATIWYTVIVSVMSLGQWWLERSMRRTRSARRIDLPAEETL